MEVKFERKKYNCHFINIYETPRIIMGFTEIHFSFQDLSCLFSPYKLVELRQVHSDILHFSSQIEPGSEGDGIILDQQGTAAVIKTADCTPLFFWDKNGSIGGVVHIGWKGLLKGIEKKLLELLKRRSVNHDIQQLNIYLGPSIEKKCYEVGPDLYERFSLKTYRDDIFYPLYPLYTDTDDGKYFMDLKKGIRLSLKESGISDHQVLESGLCTFCEKDRFPSHRRHPAAGKRIYNFLLLKIPGRGGYCHCTRRE
ncbi:MAG: peptidoglycan editing factor PgeF [Candidatus Aminicenantes bacterium]|nr:MAG: peptidoglycan editing factor PgeF [Candidatus Aminicenantes bacterium]